MTRRRVTAATLSLAAIALLGVASAAFDFSICPFAALTGIPCPGCGLGRATLALAHGDVHAALRLHPLILVVLPALAVFTFYVARPQRFTAQATRIVVASAAIVLVCLLATWAARFGGAFGGPAPVRALWAVSD
jgi:hypothetical protein